MSMRKLSNGTYIMLEIRKLGSTLETDWKVIKQPSSMRYIREDYDSEDSFRTMDLDLIRDYIGTKIKLECEWSYITIDEAEEILRNTQDEFFEIRFYDPYAGGLTKKTVYAGGTKDLEFYNVRMENGKPVVGYKSLSINFIEK